tara:strand:- start:1531 stop:1896 length:366 start_codon:yes stop_codon:yes gene_type:complete
VALATAVLELNTLDGPEGLTSSTYVPGDLGFDPLGMYGQDESQQKKMQVLFSLLSHTRSAHMSHPSLPIYHRDLFLLFLQLSEIKHGRTAMLAVTGFAVQEFFYGKPVVEQTPNFFKPFFL